MPTLGLGIRLGAVGKHAGERLDELAVVERLEHVRDGGGLESMLGELRAMPGEGDDGHGALAEDLAGRLDAVETRQIQVDQDQVRAMLARELDRLDAVAGVWDDVEFRIFENQPQIGANDRSASTARTLVHALP